MSGKEPPHPDAAHPHSPARGEGYRTESSTQNYKMQSICPRARNRNKSAYGTDKPSPLTGEGGASAPGKGEAANAQPTNSKTQRARKLRKTMTEAERKLWSLPRNRKLSGYKFRRQVPIGPYVADFLCFEARMIVEADGGQHAESARDAKRDSWFEGQGFAVLRFWNSDIFDNPEGVVQKPALTLSVHREGASL